MKTQFTPAFGSGFARLAAFTATATLATSALLPAGAEEPKPSAEASTPKRGRPDGDSTQRPAGDAPRMAPEDRLKMMTEKLGLTSEQQQKIRDIYEKNASQLRELMAKGREKATEADREKFRELMRSQLEEVTAVLNPDQKSKMMEAMKSRRDGQGSASADSQRGNAGDRIKAMTEKLDLTSEQQEKARTIFEKNAGELRELMSKGRENTSDADKQKARELIHSQMEEFTEILTPDQKAKMRDGSRGASPSAGDSAPARPGTRAKKDGDAQ